jgi:hypothetical protein
MDFESSDDATDIEQLKDEVFRQGDQINSYLKDIRAALYTIAMMLGLLLYHFLS